MSGDSCPLCEKLSHLNILPTDELVWEFPQSVALLGPWQFYRGYCVLISRHHAREMIHLPNTIRTSYLEEMCLLSQAIEQTFHPLKLNQELLGNQVPHPHWHVFPRYEEDPDRLSPVWIALHAAEKDSLLKDRLLMGSQDRSATVADLRRTLIALGAPTL